MEKRKFCKHGHEWIDENLYIFIEIKNGIEKIREKCKLCRKNYDKKIRESFHTNPRRVPTMQELANASEKLISWTELARQCGVTSKAVRNRAKRLGMM